MFSKLDIKDGFWRMAVNDENTWNFCYVLPSDDPNIDIDDIKIVVPNCLQMGWCESPPFFCAASETACDVIESLLQEVTRQNINSKTKCSTRPGKHRGNAYLLRHHMTTWLKCS